MILRKSSGMSGLSLFVVSCVTSSRLSWDQGAMMLLANGPAYRGRSGGAADGKHDDREDSVRCGFN